MNRLPFTVYDFFACLASGFLILVAVDYVFSARALLGEPPGLVVSALWVLLAYVIGHIVSHLASVILEEGILRRVLGSPEDHLLGEQKPSAWVRLFPGNFKPLPRETQDRILRKAERHSVTSAGRSLFLHCHPIVKRDKATLERLSSFLNLYGFCRSMAMAFLVIVPLLLYGALRDLDMRSLDGLRVDRLLWAAGALVASVGMFYRYLKFFRHYAVEVFVTYAELPD